MKHLLRRPVSVLLLAVLAGSLLVTLGLVAAQTYRTYNSDDVSIQTIAQNWTERGQHVAHLGSDNFALKMPVYWATNSLLYGSRTGMLIASLIFGVAGIALFLVAAFYLLGRERFKLTPTTAMALLWPALLGQVFYTMLLGTNYRNVAANASIHSSDGQSHRP